MCDYSLASIPNRLAVEGEQLVAYRFFTGSIGLTSGDALCGDCGSSKLRPSVCLLVPVCYCVIFPGTCSDSLMCKRPRR